MEFLERLERPSLSTTNGAKRLCSLVSILPQADLVERRSVADADEEDNEEYISGQRTYSVFPVEKAEYEPHIVL